MNRYDLTVLQNYEGYPAITIISPTHRTIPERQQDPIALKNLVKETKKRLLAEFPERQVEHLFEKIDSLVTNIDFKKTLDTIAIFVSDTIAQCFILPGTMTPQVVIEKKFHLKPFLRLMQRSVRYWVLALGDKPSRLFMGIASELIEIIEPEKNQLGIPQDGFPLEYLGPDESQALAIGTGDVDAHYQDEHKKTFLRKVDDLLSKFVSKDPLPVILVGSKRPLAAFQEISNNNQRIELIIEGSHSSDSVEHVAHLVWPKVDAYFQQKQLGKIEEFTKAMGALKHAFGVQAIWTAAHEGRIHELFVEKDFSVPGSTDPENPTQMILFCNEKQSSEHTIDLIDLIIDEVVNHAGAVTVVPHGSLSQYEHIAALLRY